MNYRIFGVLLVFVVISILLSFSQLYENIKYFKNLSIVPHQNIKSCDIINSKHGFDDISVLVRTYSRDSYFLPYLLLSMEKFLPELRSRVTLIYPTNDSAEVRAHMGGLISTVSVIEVLETGASIWAGYDEQQFNKLNADLFLDSPLIMHLDSDCVFVARMFHEDLFDVSSSLPIYYVQQYELLPYQGVYGVHRWRAPTAYWLGLPVEKNQHEFMRRFPFVIPRELYQLVRKRVALAHQGLSITDVFRTKAAELNRPNETAVRLSEFNLLGAAAWHWAHERVAWRDLDLRLPDKQPQVRQVWSNGYEDPVTLALNVTAMDADFCAFLSEPIGCRAAYLASTPAPSQGQMPVITR